MTADSPAIGHGFIRKFADWAHRVHLSRVAAIALAAAAVISGATTYGVITEGGFTANPQTVYLLQLLNLALLLMLGIVVAWRIVRLWAERRRGLAGSKLHVQLAVLFSAVAAAPTVIIAVFSTLFFNLGVEAWFSERVRVALGESQSVAEAYREEHRNLIRNDLLAMAADLNRQAPRLISDIRFFGQLLEAQAVLRSLPEAVAFDSRGRILASVNRTGTPQESRFPPWALERAVRGDLVVFDPDEEEGPTMGLGDRVRALYKLVGFEEDIFLMVGRFVDPRVIGHLDRNREAIQLYQGIEGRRSDLQTTFAIVFAVVALLLLLVSVWVGLVLANRLARPIAELVGAAERVRAGDLGARVSEAEAAGEVSLLSRAFNRMTRQLEAQRHELVEANRQIDGRRRFTEAVLTGVSSGVIGLDAEGRINLPNRSASVLLSADLNQLIGSDFRAVVPEMVPLLEGARAVPERHVEGQVVILRAGRRRTLFARIAGQRLESGTLGFVVTFDDITELEAAQRKAAWSDIARRIAHEIKNPLTPIQLSAERLKRKYMSEITSDPETFRICTETIVRQVGDIGRMVDEFSSFARMPAPIMRDEDLGELVRQTVFLQRNARPEITFECELPDTGVRRSLDSRQIGQALTNLIKNAIEAIEGRERPQDGTALPPGHVIVRLAERDGSWAIMVDDNGRGLPVENRERLAEPYVTTRAKGTGLGLAIVKKIMEDHSGELLLEDRPGGGTRVSLVFPAVAAAPNSEEQPVKTALHGT